MTETEAKVVAAWKEASEDLGIRFTSPVSVTAPDGRQVECLGLVHQFGGRIGALISVQGEPSAQLAYPSDQDYFWAQLSVAASRYRRRWFIQALEDWEFFGSEAERPAWYSGASWS